MTQPEQADGRPEIDPSGIRVLVVEDDDLLLGFLVKSLASGGYQVDAVADGAQAIQRIEADPYDVVITDLRLPVEDGGAVLRAARQVDDRTAVIVISGYGTIETAVELMKQGATDFLAKPLSHEQLHLKIHRALRLRCLEDMARASRYFEKLSLTDDLTVLPNRRAFNDAILKEANRALRYDHPLGLLMIDLDHFKQVNDTHGHPAGDEVLRQVAHLLNQAVRRHDTIARWGGDEFALLLPVTDALGVSSLGIRLLQLVRETVFHAHGSGVEVRLTASAGSATLPTHTRDPQELVRLADRHMYLAKKRGRDRLCSPEDEAEPAPEGPQDPT